MVGRGSVGGSHSATAASPRRRAVLAGLVTGAGAAGAGTYYVTARDSSERTLTGHGDGVWAVAWAPDGRTLASGSSDCTARIWDAGTGRGLRTLTGHHDWVGDVAWSPDGRALATTGGPRN